MSAHVLAVRLASRTETAERAGTAARAGGEGAS